MQAIKPEIMMISTGARFKMSTIERGTNRQIAIVFVVQLVFCLFGAILCTVYSIQMTDASYVEDTDSSSTSAWDSKCCIDGH